MHCFVMGFLKEPGQEFHGHDDRLPAAVVISSGEACRYGCICYLFY